MKLLYTGPISTWMGDCLWANEQPLGPKVGGHLALRATIVKWTGWTHAVSVRCYDNSTISIFVAITITSTIIVITHSVPVYQLTRKWLTPKRKLVCQFTSAPVMNNNNNNSNSQDNVYGAVIVTVHCHCESSPGSSDECSMQRQVAADLRTKPISLSQ